MAEKYKGEFSAADIEEYWENDMLPHDEGLLATPPPRNAPGEARSTDEPEPDPVSSDEIAARFYKAFAQGGNGKGVPKEVFLSLVAYIGSGTRYMGQGEGDVVGEDAIRSAVESSAADPVQLSALATTVQNFRANPLEVWNCPPNKS